MMRLKKLVFQGQHTGIIRIVMQEALQAIQRLEIIAQLPGHLHDGYAQAQPILGKERPLQALL